MKTYVVAFTDQSRFDLIDIGDFIALDNSHRAESFISELVSFAESFLSAFPYSAKTRYPDFPMVRMMPYRRYNIYYQILEDTSVVQILHIYNSAKQAPY